MVRLDNLDDVKQLKADLHQSFDSESGQRALNFIKQIGGWWPTHFDSKDTNDIIGRDHTRRVLGTIRTLMQLNPEQIVALNNKE